MRHCRQDARERHDELSHHVFLENEVSANDDIGRRKCRIVMGGPVEPRGAHRAQQPRRICADQWSKAREHATRAAHCTRRCAAALQRPCRGHLSARPRQHRLGGNVSIANRLARRAGGGESAPCAATRPASPRPAPSSTTRRPRTHDGSRSRKSARAKPAVHNESPVVPCAIMAPPSGVVTQANGSCERTTVRNDGVTCSLAPLTSSTYALYRSSSTSCRHNVSHQAGKAPNPSPHRATPLSGIDDGAQRSPP